MKLAPILLLLIVCASIASALPLAAEQFAENCNGQIVYENGLVTCMQNSFQWQEFYKQLTPAGYLLLGATIFLIYRMFVLTRIKTPKEANQ